MVRKNEQVAREVKPELRGGKGNAEFEHFLTKDNDEFYGKGRIFSKITLKKGCSIGYHIHEGEMESFYINAGNPVYNDNGTEYVLSPGDVTLTRAGEGHSVENRGDADVELIALILFA